jgi:hypothetical protein
VGGRQRSWSCGDLTEPRRAVCVRGVASCFCGPSAPGATRAGSTEPGRAGTGSGSLVAAVDAPWKWTRARTRLAPCVRHAETTRPARRLEREEHLSASILLSQWVAVNSHHCGQEWWQLATTIGNGLGGGAAFGERRNGSKARNAGRKFKATPRAYRSLVHVFDAINHT